MCRRVSILNDIVETPLFMKVSYFQYFMSPTAEPFHLSVKQDQKIKAVEV